MNAEELMIGDYMEYSHRPFTVKELSALDDENIFGRVAVTGDLKNVMGDIRPIQLTADIVKKNGWVLTEVGDNGPATPKINRNRFEKWVLKKAWVYEVLFYDRLTKKWKLNGLNRVQFEFVHELQHALKYAKSEISIEL